MFLPNVNLLLFLYGVLILIKQFSRTLLLFRKYVEWRDKGFKNTFKIFVFERWSYCEMNDLFWNMYCFCTFSNDCLQTICSQKCSQCSKSSRNKAHVLRLKQKSFYTNIFRNIIPVGVSKNLKCFRCIKFVSFQIKKWISHFSFAMHFSYARL